MNDSATEIDLIDALIPTMASTPLYAIRRQRDKVVAATQGSYQAIFDPASSVPSLAERLLVAQSIAKRSGSTELAAHYHGRLKSDVVLTAPQQAALHGEEAGDDQQLVAMLDFARLLTERPVKGDRSALLRLPAAGLDTAATVALAQLIAFVAYQVRIVAGLQAMAFLGATGDARPQTAQAKVLPFVHPANLPKPGEPIRINGFTSETLDWKSWLPVLALDTATPEQLAVLDSSHPKARSSDYYRLLAHQPRILQERSNAFNAIMYAPGGLSRAERELASAAVSRVNGCVYCAAVHAQRFEQLTKRNDAIVQLFTEPITAGTNARERAVVQAAIALTQKPERFAAADLTAAKTAGLSALEMLDLVHAIAIFAWANRLMLNLGEPVPSA